MRAIKLRTEHLDDPLGIDEPKPYLSWKCRGGIRQTAYRVVAFHEDEAVWDSGKVKTDDMYCHFGGSAKSRQRINWKVQLWDENDISGEWSEEAFFEMAFLDPSCWTARWIDPEQGLEKNVRRPASYLKKSFLVKERKAGRLYITCHGVYAAYLNGLRVSDFILAPGTCEYAKRLYYQTYDVTSFLRKGENELMVVLGDGWYRGSNGIDGKCDLHGSDTALLCQLEIDGSVAVVSDKSWVASQDGAIRYNDLQGGEIVDACRGNGIGCHAVKEKDFDLSNLMCSNSVAVHEQETFKPKIIITPKGETVLDFGQNMAGYVEFAVNAGQGQTIKLIHGETLDADGNFTIENFQPAGKNRHRITQEIHYTCKEGLNRYKPSFCIFGFQYVKLETSISAERFDFTAHAVYSDMERTGWFSCGSEEVNQLVHNTVWSQKSNFVDIPTDCPTRERAGWTGDAGAFIQTGLYLMDCYPIYRKWLRDLRDIQLPDGNVAFMAPRTDDGGGAAAFINGGAGWGDAAVIVPYVLYKAYGDERILKENYDSMQRWIDFSEKRAQKSRLRNRLSKNPYKKYVVDTGFHWGEWLEPDVPTLNALIKNVLHGAPEVATAYFAYSVKLMTEIAEKLGKTQDALRYEKLAEKIRAAYHSVALLDGKIRSDRQCRYVRPIALGLLTETEEKEAAAALNRMVIRNGYHLNTGFLSTPFLCRVLSDHCYVDTAYKLLLQEECPGWIYAVKKGANTIWETWDGKQPDGRVHDSLNHYSYGAVTGWLFGSVCGIDVRGKKITIAPQPDVSLKYAQAAWDSPLGLIKSGWHYEEDTIIYEMEIPTNCEAEVILEGEKRMLSSGSYRLAAEDGSRMAVSDSMRGNIHLGEMGCFEGRWNGQ